MSAAVSYSWNKASEEIICDHLKRCDANFLPPLSSRVEINEYAKKITNSAMRAEAWSDNKLVGLVSVYCNDQQTLIAYITSVSVLKSWTGIGVASSLLNNCIKLAKNMGARKVMLEVAIDNISAVKLYEKMGFVSSKLNSKQIVMTLSVE
jgi:ribosomal protein S18 acetylase RimI-like enzyme